MQQLNKNELNFDALKYEATAFNFCFPLDAFAYSNLSGTCRHISHPHIHECMFRLHDDMKFRPCIPRSLKHTLIRMTYSHRLKKHILGQK